MNLSEKRHKLLSYFVESTKFNTAFDDDEMYYFCRKVKNARVESVEDFLNRFKSENDILDDLICKNLLTFNYPFNAVAERMYISLITEKENKTKEYWSNSHSPLKEFLTFSSTEAKRIFNFRKIEDSVSGKNKT